MLRRYPSLFLLAFVVTGIVIADIVHLPVWLSLALAVACLLVAVVRLKNAPSWQTAVMVGSAIFFFSTFNFAIRMYDTGPNHISKVITEKQRYRIFATVADWPLVKNDRTEIPLSIDSLVDTRTIIAHGNILLKLADSSTALQRGDKIQFSARIYPLREVRSSSGFDYRRYLNLRGLFGIAYLTTPLDIQIDRTFESGLFGLVARLRSSIRDCFKDNLSGDAAALAAGFLIGETRDIPIKVYNRFRDSGTLHLLAVSGSNVALVILVFVFAMQPLPISRRQRGLVLLSVIVLFSLLSYGEPSVIRASVMAVIVILAGMVERRFELNNVISLTGLIILLWDPTQLFRVGFQLSFVVAWGLIFFVPRLLAPLKRWRERRWYMWLAMPVAVSLVAQFCSAPLIAFYFQKIPAISFLANLIIVPLVSLAVVGVVALLGSALLLPQLGLFVGSFLSMLLELILSLLRLLGDDMTGMITTPDMPVAVVLLLYLLYLSLALSATDVRLRRMTAFGILIMANVLLAVGTVRARETPHQTVVCQAIPGGVAAVVQSIRKDHADLVITGIKGKTYPIEERIIEPLLQSVAVNRIDRIIVLSAAYDGIDDILRLADRYDTPVLYVAADIENSFRDAVRFSGRLPSVLQVTSFADRKAEVRGRGYYPFGENLLILFDQLSLLLISGSRPPSPDSLSAFNDVIYIFGQETDPDHLTKLYSHPVSYLSVICSKISQPVSTGHVDSGQGTAAAKSWDLSRVGPVRIVIPLDPKARPRLEPVY